MTATKRYWRKVVRRDYYHNPGYEKSWAVGGGQILTLECGHEVRRKLSARVPDKVLCPDCKSRSRGGTCSWFNRSTKQVTEETWDPVAELPRKTTRDMTPEEIAEWCAPYLSPEHT